jgi:thioredoxin 1
LQVIDFTASWCPPCQAIKPIFEGLANQNADVNFLKVDLSEGTNDLATEYSVTAMSVSIVWRVSSVLIFHRPTFIFLVGGKEVHRIRGANPAFVHKFSFL